MKSLTFASWFTTWQLAWPGLILTAVLTAAYVVLWVRVRGREGHPGMVPLGLYLMLGSFTLLYVTCGFIGVGSQTFMWVFALKIAVLDAITPLGFALGRPVEVLCAATGSERPRRLLQGLVPRILMYPLVSSIVGLVSILAVFYTSYGQRSLENSGIELVLLCHILVVGTIVILPLLTDDLLPQWATPGVRALLACLDGLLDALPGILVMTSSSLLMPHFPGFIGYHAARSGMSASLDQKFAGGALLAVAEAIGVPLLIAVFIEWQRADVSEARAVDARLDADLDDGQATTVPWWIQPNTNDDDG